MPVTTVVLWTLIPLAAAAVAGVVAAIRPPGVRLTSVLQHLAAGVVFAAAAIELVPPVLQQDPAVAVTGFAIGIAVLQGMRWIEGRVYDEQPHGVIPWGLVGATGLDFLVDGLVLGAGFAAGGQKGPLLTVALTLEYLFVGLSVATSLAQRASSLHRVGLPAALALLTVAGSAIGSVLLAGASPAVLAGFLAFGAVAFMYLVTEELLVKAHQRGATAWGSATFFVGFLLYMVVRELIG